MITTIRKIGIVEIDTVLLYTLKADIFHDTSNNKFLARVRVTDLRLPQGYRNIDDLQYLMGPASEVREPKEFEDKNKEALYESIERYAKQVGRRIIGRPQRRTIGRFKF